MTRAIHEHDTTIDHGQQGDLHKKCASAMTNMITKRCDLSNTWQPASKEFSNVINDTFGTLGSHVCLSYFCTPIKT